MKQLCFILFINVFLIYSILSSTIFSMEQKEDSLTLISMQEKKIEPYRPVHCKVYLGHPPEGVKVLIDFYTNVMKSSHQNKSIPRPHFVKVCGQSDTGKTHLIKLIAYRINCPQSNFFQTNTSSPSENLKETIDNFYKKATWGYPCVILITGKLPYESKKLLRDYFLEIKKSENPLIVFHETKKVLEKDSYYYDEIIRVKKPSANNILSILTVILNSHPFDSMKHQTINALTGCTYSQIEHIANRAIRAAFLAHSPSITNEHIVDALSLQKPRTLKKIVLD